jgi:hypothetical protein
MDNKQDENTRGRRGFLKFLGVSSAGVAVVGAAHAVKEKTEQGVEITKAEVDKLKEDYERLDRKTQFILKAVLALSGLDIFLSL